MIINNKNGFKVRVNDDMLNTLEYIDGDVVVEILEEASREDIKDGWVRDDIYESSSYELYYYHESDGEIRDAEREGRFDDIMEATEISGALETFDGDIDGFKFKIGCALRWINISREIADLLEYVEILEDDYIDEEELDNYEPSDEEIQDILDEAYDMMGKYYNRNIEIFLINNYFYFSREVFNSMFEDGRLLSDEVNKYISFKDGIDEYDEPVEFEELDEDTQEYIKNEIEREFEFYDVDGEYWSESYLETLADKHPIFNNFKFYSWDLSYCQGSHIKFEGDIYAKDLKQLIYDFRYKIFDVIDTRYSSYWWNDEDKKNTIKAILRMDDEECIEFEQSAWVGVNVRYLGDTFDRYDDDLNRINMVEELIKYLIMEIQHDLLNNAYNNIEDYIEGMKEDRLEMYKEDYLFTKDGEPVERW